MEYRYESKIKNDTIVIRFEEAGIKHQYPLVLEDVQEAQKRLSDPEWYGEVTLRLASPIACTGDYAGVTMQHIVLEIEGRTARFTYFTDRMVTRTFVRNDLIRCFRNLIKQLNKESR